MHVVGVAPSILVRSHFPRVSQRNSAWELGSPARLFGFEHVAGLSVVRAPWPHPGCAKYQYV